MSRGRQAQVINSLLEATVAAGMIATIIIAPNALTIAGKKFRKTIRSDENRDLRKVITYMKAKKYVQVDTLADGTQTNYNYRARQDTIREKRI